MKSIHGSQDLPQEFILKSSLTKRVSTAAQRMEATFPSEEYTGREHHGPKRPRFFDEKMRNLCWQKADVVPGRHPERWRKDAAGNIVCRKFSGCDGCLCYDYDHIIPFSKGGETKVENCQILQSRVNRYKGSKEDMGKNDLERYSCDIKFTDKELDIIEMAVYGNVIRPGLQCRCKSVAEMLGQIKSKGPQMACELPYKGIQ